MTRIRPLSTGVAALAVTATAAALAAPAYAERPARTSPPQTIALPSGFAPEGIESVGRTAYVGSLADGDIVRVDLRTGDVTPLYGGDGTPTTGLEVSGRYLLGAGNTDGDLIVVDRRTGDLLADVQLADPTDGPTFINDIVVLDGVAYATDSQRAALYAVPLTGGLPDDGDVETLPLTGEWTQPAGLGANGIETTPDGSALLVVNSTEGQLYRVDPATGEATAVEGGDGLSNGDGLLLRGSTLYVVQNRDNQVAVLEVSDDGTSATRTGTVTDPDFDVPTTVTTWGGALYLPNAKFGEDTTDYEVVRAGR